MPADRIDAFARELWRDRPLGLEIRPGGLDAWWTLDQAPPWTGAEPGVQLEAEERVGEEDWLAGWREGALPFALGRRFWVDPGEGERGSARQGGALPRGPAASAPPGRIELRLPARRAFGTGGHASTRLAVAFLEEIPMAGRDVLDVGAGSGILAFACRALGARRVVGVECELESVLLAGANRRLNRLEVGLVGGTVGALAGASFGVIVANLLSSELEPELASLQALLEPRGDLVYSGALTDEAPRLRERFLAHGLEPLDEKTEGEWSAFRLRRGRAT